MYYSTVGGVTPDILIALIRDARQGGEIDNYKIIIITCGNANNSKYIIYNHVWSQHEILVNIINYDIFRNTVYHTCIIKYRVIQRKLTPTFAFAAVGWYYFSKSFENQASHLIPPPPPPPPHPTHTHTHTHTTHWAKNPFWWTGA